ncbi:cationic peroxidase SPC4 [Brachypodium distachyon]|uniref:Peroxidase n=1 Tax=Brachypodium distachyon TaxID=15368 RepID=A0A0Q3ECI8_BRADI|nr:cationic peroxidase SPC4 [Brachypodium distachyon]KQJ85478.2 hypothetical protein BRADI_5g27200v3 [Brachypodium distachyon]|eukprot:XP_010240654.1 cationic peroxidase SPC4 [Brachypodium distachyon]
MTMATAMVAAVLLLLTISPAAAAALSPHFHADSCPELESIVRTSVEAALEEEIALAAGLLRVFFHDCFPQGCDGSVFLTGRNSEQSLGPNLTLQPRALQLVDAIRAKAHAACGPTVSCADISALATRDAVVFSGGPNYTVPLGNLDSLTPASAKAVMTLPSPITSSVAALFEAFRTRGLVELTDLVALSGVHTVGRAGCRFFADRSAKQDDTFSKKLAANCSVEPDRLQNLDVITPDVFDNGYFKALMFNQGVFTSDMALVKDKDTAPIVKRFAGSKDKFFKQFVKSMEKLVNAPRPDGNVGEIRRSCSSPNGDDGEKEDFAVASA